MKTKHTAKKILALILTLTLVANNGIFASAATQTKLRFSESYAQNQVKDSGEGTENPDFSIVNGLLTKYTGNQEEVVIPDSVTKIGQGAFQSNSKLQKVTVPTTVESIGNNAFAYCSSLRTVTMKEGSMKTIGKNAFYVCTNLQNITIPEGVESIESGAFSHEGASFKIIDLPASITTLGMGVTDVFEKSNGMTSINLDDRNTHYSSLDGVVYSEDSKTLYFCPRGKIGGYTVAQETAEIGTSAFADCLLDYVGLPKGLESIKASAFENSKLVDISIPGSVKTIGDYAFYNCGKLENAVLENGSERIGKCVFSSCYKLNGLRIPSSVKEIGRGMADDLSSSFQWMAIEGSDTVLVSGFLENRAIPVYGPENSTIKQYIANQSNSKFSFHPISEFVLTDRVTLNVSSFALDPDDTRTLTAVVEPDNAVAKAITWISTDSRIASVDSSGKIMAKEQGNCTILAKTGNGKFASCKVTVGGGGQSSDYAIGQNGLITSYNGEEADLSIPEEVDGIKVTGIAPKAFAGNMEIHSVILPLGVVLIGDSAFENCRNLTTVSLNSTVVSIGASAFADCVFLSGIELPNSVTVLGKNAFSGCTRLKSAKLSSSLTSIEESTFSSCLALTQITVPEGITVLRKNAFTSSGVQNVTLPGSLRTLESYVFSYCYALKALEVPEGVTVIEDKAFFNCIALEALSFPSTATKIGGQYLAGLFEEGETVPGAKSLQTIVVAVKNPVYSSYGGAVYSGTTLLFSPRGREQVKIREGTTAVGDYGFFLSFDLKKVEIPSSLVSIGHDAFHYCESLTDCILPQGLKTVGASAFFGCEAWESMNIPSTVTEIGPYGFAECESAKEIIIPKGIKVIENYAFWGCNEVQKIIIPDSVESIGDSAFSVSKGITEIVIPKKVTRIGNQAFAACRMLKKVTLPTGLRFIGKEAFALNDELESIFIPSSVTEMGNNVFKDCPKGPAIVSDSATSAAAEYAKKHQLKFSFSGSTDSNDSNSRRKNKKTPVKTENGTAPADVVVTELQPDKAPSLSGNRSCVTVTVPDSAIYSLSGATAENPVNIQISPSAAPIVEQIKNVAVQTVELNLQVSSFIVNNTNAFGTVSIHVKPEILQVAKDTGKNLTFRVTDSQTGRELYSWTFSGAELKKSAVAIGEMDLSLRIASVSCNTAVAPVVAKNGIGRTGLVFQFGKNGLLPAPTGIRVYVGNQNGFAPGSNAYLYYFNSETKALEQLRQDNLKVDAGGYVIVTIAHCSEYVLLSQAAANPYPVQSDTTFPVNVQKGRNYTIAITAKGSAAPVLTIGDGKAFRSVLRQEGNRYLLTVTAIGAPRTVTALYSTLPGQKPVVLTYLIVAR